MLAPVGHSSLKVLVALHLAEPSGPSRTLTPVLAALAKAGSEVVIAVPGPGRAAAEMQHIGRSIVTGHQPLTIPRTPRAVWTLARRMRRETRVFRGVLRAERPDVVIIATTTLLSLSLAARLERVPAVVYATELYRQGRRGDSVRFIVGRTVMRFNARLAAITVVPSRAVADAIARPDRVIVTHPAVEATVTDGDPDAFRREHGLPAKGPCLATLGNIARGRGQDVAIRALADVRRDHPDAHLVIAGEPFPRPGDRAFAAELEDLAVELGVRDAVHLCGFVRPGDLFGACDVLMNPARFSETFGRASMEALMAGRPVVSSRVGAVTEVLEHGRHALLVTPDRPAELADALRLLLRDRALTDRLVSEGREHVASSFTEQRLVGDFQTAIERAMAPARGGEA